MKNSCFNEFTNLYPLSKTLRFELQPVGKTYENFMNSGILEEDRDRASSYAIVKNYIDEYHKHFIDDVLSKVRFGSYLVEYAVLYKDKESKKELKKLQAAMRKHVIDAFKKDAAFVDLFKKELIRNRLPEFFNDSEKQEIINKFRSFTTYFVGFHENRNNIYSPEEKSTSLAYRLVNQNLPRFLDNIKIFEELKNSPAGAGLSEINDRLKRFLNIDNISELFETGYYDRCLMQPQIDFYNSIIGGVALKDGTKVKGLNEYVNEHKKECKLPKFKFLHKQILSDRNTDSFVPETFKNDGEVLMGISEFYKKLDNGFFSRLEELLGNIGQFDLNKIYLSNDQSVTDVSQRFYGDWSLINRVLEKKVISENPQNKKERPDKYEERILKILKKQEVISLAFIDGALVDSGVEGEYPPVESYFKALKFRHDDEKSVDDEVKGFYEAFKGLLNDVSSGNELSLKQNDEAVERIKNLADSIKNLQAFIKPLAGGNDVYDKDERFYAEFDELYGILAGINPLYNKIRDYLTQKPYSEAKIKLNFGQSTLLEGWDVNKEKDNLSVLFRKEGLYYLAIIDKKHKQVFARPFDDVRGDCYEKMEYKYVPEAVKMFPKVFLSEKGKKTYKPSEEIRAIYGRGAHKKGGDFNLADCHKLIDFFKDSLAVHPEWGVFGYEFSDTTSYKDIRDFYREVDRQGYKLSFRDIPVTYIDRLVDEGKIYLYKIYNKDFSVHSKGRPNLHTLYWKLLFDENNLKDTVYKLNGQAEIFYREASLKRNITHPANVPIDMKSGGNKGKKRVLAYDLIKDKRYTEPKFHFHVPISMNFKSKEVDNINTSVRNSIRNNKGMHVIGIDRGERNLLYLSVINSEGEIVEQLSLNEVANNYGNTEFKVNYRDLLAGKEQERDKVRKSWGKIEKIKMLKEGYLSQVVHKIALLMLKYDAIVVLEDLNVKFKQNRQKIERQVYQKFEKALIDKLSYLVFKDKAPSEIGGSMHALQLTNPVKTLNEIRKQCGFLFYIPAWNTSKLDPATGFVNLFDARYENKESARRFLGKFKDIRYNKAQNYFEFEFDYSDFTAKAEGCRTEWTVCTFGSRIETYRDPKRQNQFVSKEVDLTAEFVKLFDAYFVDYIGDLKKKILERSESIFFNKLLRLFRLTLQMRNSMSNSDLDYLVSPVKQNGVFYDSRKAGPALPDNADANGAYNIARKGLMVMDRIRGAASAEDKIDMSITNKEWLRYAQHIGE